MLNSPIRFNSPTGFSGFREQTPSEFQSLIVRRTLEKFANAGTSNATFQTGHIHVNGVHAGISGISGGTTIGTFLDTRRDAQPGEVETTTTTVTYEFKQKLDAVAESGIYHPMVIETGTGTVREMTNAEFDSMITDVMTELTAGGPGSYYLDPSAPGTGTWVSVAEVVNIANSSANNTTTLWKCVTSAGTANTENRPIRLDTVSNAAEVQLKQMTDAEMEAFALRIRNTVVSTGIGEYRIQDAAPGVGTWVQMGSTFSDTRHQVAGQSFTSSYTGTSIGAFTGQYSGLFTGERGAIFTGQYSGAFTAQYTGIYSQVFTGNYTGIYSRAFTGLYTGTFTGLYAGAYTRGYAGAYVSYFAGSYAGAYGGSYLGYYVGYYASWVNKFYTRIVGFGPDLEPVYYTGTYLRSYAGAYAGWYVGYYLGYYAGYRIHGYWTGTYNTAYTGVYAGGYVSSYSGAFVGNFTGVYAGGYVGNFTAQYAQSYTGQFTGDYGAIYTGQYTGLFTGVFGQNYTGSYTRDDPQSIVQPTFETISTVRLWLRTA